MAFDFVTEDKILDAITEKSDREKMKSIMDSAGDDVRWNIIDKDKKNGKIVAWPLMASGKPTKISNNICKTRWKHSSTHCWITFY